MSETVERVALKYGELVFSMDQPARHMLDKVLAYRPKPKSKPAKKRVRRARKVQRDNRP